MKNWASALVAIAIGLGATGNGWSAGAGGFSGARPPVPQSPRTPAAPQYAYPPGYGHFYPPYRTPLPGSMPPAKAPGDSTPHEPRTGQAGNTSRPLPPRAAPVPSPPPSQEPIREMLRAREDQRQQQIRAQRDALYYYYFGQRSGLPD